MSTRFLTGAVVLLGLLVARAAGPLATPVPEPASSSLAICGTLFLAAAAARKFFKN
jgi:hypothetical protein